MKRCNRWKNAFMDFYLSSIILIALLMITITISLSRTRTEKSISALIIWSPTRLLCTAAGHSLSTVPTKDKEFAMAEIDLKEKGVTLPFIGAKGGSYYYLMIYGGPRYASAHSYRIRTSFTKGKSLSQKRRRKILRQVGEHHSQDKEKVILLMIIMGSYPLAG